MFSAGWKSQIQEKVSKRKDRNTIKIPLETNEELNYGVAYSLGICLRSPYPVYLHGRADEKKINETETENHR